MFSFGNGKFGDNSRFGEALGKACANNNFQGQNPFKIDLGKAFAHAEPGKLFGKFEGFGKNHDDHGASGNQPCDPHPVIPAPAPANCGTGQNNHANDSHHGEEQANHHDAHSGHDNHLPPTPPAGGHDHGHGTGGNHGSGHDDHSGGHAGDCNTGGHSNSGHDDHHDGDHDGDHHGGGTEGTGFPAIPADTTGITFHVDFDGDGLMDQYIYIQLEQGVDPASMTMADYYKSAVAELKDANPDADPSKVIVKATVYSPSEYETHFYLTGNELGTEDEGDAEGHHGHDDHQDEGHSGQDGHHHGHGLHSSHGTKEHEHHGERPEHGQPGDHQGNDDHEAGHDESHGEGHGEGHEASHEGSHEGSHDNDHDSGCAPKGDDHGGTHEAGHENGHEAEHDGEGHDDGSHYYKAFVGMFGDVAACDPAPEEDDSDDAEESHPVLENCL